MLIKIEVDDDRFPNDDVIEVGWNRNKEDAIQKYIGEFCKRNNALWIDFYYNATDEKVDNEDQNNKHFDLAQILKTGYQKRKFSNTSTVNWLQTWRISNL